MNAGGWLVMVLAVGGMSALLGWCIHRVVTRPETKDHLHAPLDIDTGD